MKESPEFIGRHYSEDEKESLQQAMQSWSKDSLLPIEGELEKTEDEVLMIETLNSFVQDELEELGIDTYKPIELERIHLLPENDFKMKFPDSSDAKAFFISVDNAVYLNRGIVDSKVRLISTFLHELIHRASSQKFHADNEDGFVRDARVGYRLSSHWKKTEGRKNRLRGFNELITDFMVYKILLKNQQELESKLGITKEDIEGPNYTYMHYGPILESILNKISMENSVPQSKVFEDLERGLFTNNLLVLRDIDNSFGRGSVEILSLLQSLNENEANKKLEQMIKDYFSEQDNKKRESLSKEIKIFFNASFSK